MVTLNGRQMPAADAFGNGDAVTGGQAATRVPSTSPTWLPKPSARSRSTRPVVPTSPRAASVPRSTSGRPVRSTTTAWLPTSASRRRTTSPLRSATTSRRKCRASSASRMTPRRSASALTASYRSARAGALNPRSTIGTSAHGATRPSRSARSTSNTDIREPPAEGQLYGIPERHSLRVLRLRA